VFNFDTYLTKYPLFYATPGTIYMAHSHWPHKDNFKTSLCLGLLHYKFCNDIEKLKVCAAQGGYGSGCAELKKIISHVDKNGETELYHSGSLKYETSAQLNQIDIWGIGRK